MLGVGPTHADDSAARPTPDSEELPHLCAVLPTEPSAKLPGSYLLPGEEAPEEGPARKLRELADVAPQEFAAGMVEAGGTVCRVVGAELRGAGAGEEVVGVVGMAV